jgi:FHS family L-fucose permease-like MFS transporter
MALPTMSAPDAAARNNDRSMFLLSLALFFIWGFATVLIDILIPKFRSLFSLSFAEAMLTQFAFFLGYFIFSLPAGNLVARIGYLRGIVVGLVVMAAGCLGFIPATWLGAYPAFLAALFVMAAGITTLQVSANAVISISGPAERSSARLTLAQAFNSLGTFIGPFVGAKLILDHPSPSAAELSVLSPEALASMRLEEAAVLQVPYLGIAAVLLVLTAIFWFKRDLLPRAEATATSTGLGFHLLSNRRVAFGVIAIFAYVGAEVSIGSLLVNYLSRPAVLGVSEADAGRLVALYWGGAMVGRFIGAYLLGRFRPGLVLASFAAATISLALLSGLSSGVFAAGLILAVGLFNSIMFPTIFSQALAGLDDANTPKAAALLCMGIVGGALLPLATGLVADLAGLGVSLIVPAIAYGWVLFFGLFVARSRAGAA